MNLISIGVGIGAGIATALLYAAPVAGTAFAIPLFLLSPLPIAIASLGWGWTIGLLATIVSAIIVSGVAIQFGLNPLTGPVFALLYALPVVWLSYLAGLSRPAASGPEGSREWFPPGRLLRHAVVSVAGTIIIAGILVRYSPGPLADEVVAALAVWNEAAGEAAAGAMPEENARAFADVVVGILPYTTAILSMTMLLLSLWLGGKVTASSGLLQRPAIPLWTAMLPVWLVGAFGAAAILTLLPFPINAMAGVFAGAAGFAFTLAGFAAIHAMTIGLSARPIILAATYIACLLSVPLILILLIGIADSLFGIRNRFTPKSST